MGDHLAEGSLRFNEKRKLGIQRKRGKAQSGVGPQGSRAEA